MSEFYPANFQCVTTMLFFAEEVVSEILEEEWDGTFEEAVEKAESAQRNRNNGESKADQKTNWMEIRAKGCFKNVDLSGLVSIVIGTRLRWGRDIGDLVKLRDIRNECFHAARGHIENEKFSDMMREIEDSVRSLTRYDRVVLQKARTLASQAYRQRKDARRKKDEFGDAIRNQDKNTLLELVCEQTHDLKLASRFCELLLSESAWSATLKRDKDLRRHFWAFSVLWIDESQPELTEQLVLTLKALIPFERDEARTIEKILIRILETNGESTEMIQLCYTLMIDPHFQPMLTCSSLCRALKLPLDEPSRDGLLQEVALAVRNSCATGDQLESVSEVYSLAQNHHVDGYVVMVEDTIIQLLNDRKGQTSRALFSILKQKWNNRFAERKDIAQALIFALGTYKTDCKWILQKILEQSRMPGRAADLKGLGAVAKIQEYFITDTEVVIDALMIIDDPISPSSVALFETSVDSSQNTIPIARLLLEAPRVPKTPRFVIKLLALHGDSDVGVAQYGLRAIADVCRADEKLVLEFAKLNACEMVMKLAVKWVTHSATVAAQFANSITELARLTGSSEDADITIDDWPIKARLELSARMISRIRGKMDKLKATAKLAPSVVNNTAKISVRLFAAGVCELVLDSMEKWPEDADVIRFGGSALGALARFDLAKHLCQAIIASKNSVLVNKLSPNVRAHGD